MWQRTVWILVLGMSAACLDVATVPAVHTPLASSQPLGEHLWVFHIAGGPYAAHIQLLAIGDGADAQGRRVFRPIASRAWDGTPTNDLAGFQATADDSAGSTWTLHSTGGEILRLAYAVAGDTATGALTLADGTLYPAFGVRFDSAAVRLIAPVPPRPGRGCRTGGHAGPAVGAFNTPYQCTPGTHKRSCVRRLSTWIDRGTCHSNAPGGQHGVRQLG